MSLNVTRARVKEKCSIADTAYDATIDNLIAEIVPVVEYAIRPEHVANTGDTGLLATLNLAATEIVCGEFEAQTMREPGAAEGIRLGDFQLSPFSRSSVSDPSEMIGRGWARLRPYLKLDPVVPTPSAIGVAANRLGEEAE